MAGIFHLLDRLKSSDRPGGKVSFLIVGLGNPGPKYQNTRHNVGFCAADKIAEACGVSFEKTKFHALIADCRIEGKRGLLMKPLTFMNQSGIAVEEAKSFYELDISDVIILADDISLPPGRLRIRKKGSAGGHNGLKSIIYSTGEEDFPRVKIGVGKKPSADYDLARWVLGTFSPGQREQVDDAIAQTVDAVRLMVEGKYDQAMNRYN